jgi:photosystem II stability/assembly factor-like uncharacterized protein
MRKIFVGFLMVISITSWGQLEMFKGMSMRSIGPATTSGRVTAIDVDINANTYYIGAASGGVWKSESGGATWEPIFDKEAVLGIGAVKISPSHPDVVWVGTGEGNPRNSQTSGRGIYRSLDRGNSWQCMGLEETKTIHRICIDQSDNVYAAALGSAWGPNIDRGVFYYNNQNKSWKKILYVNDSTGCADLVMDPRNDQKLLAAMWQYQRQPWQFNSGGNGSGLYMTVNGGQDWKKLTDKDGLPKGKLGRIGLAIAPSDSRIVYAMIESEKTGLYKSTDGGHHWSLVTDKGVEDRPFYYSEFYVDPSNPNHLIYLHSIVSESIDGGKTWSTMLPYWGVHPDHHAFWWNPNNTLEMWEGNDGGLNVSRDGGKNWNFIPNLPLGQFYHIHYDHQTPYNVYGGLQDNGTWKGPGYVWHSNGILDSDWQELYFGDGFDAVPDPSDENYVYVLSQGGNMGRVNATTGEEHFVQPVHPEGKPLRFHWNTGISNDPFIETGIYIGSQYLHYSTNNGQSWEIISPDLTTNDTTKQHAYRSGGLTTDATSAENYCTIITIEPSVFNAGEIWVGTDDGQVSMTTDHGKTWKNITANIKGLPKGAWIPQIVLSQDDPKEIWVVANHYRQNDWKPYLFHSTDGGRKWENVVEKANMTGHCLSVAQDKFEPELVFCGTEHGLFVSMDRGTSWEKWKHDYPSVATQDLKIHPDNGDLIIGTFGRAIYILDDISPLRDWINNGKQINDSLSVYNSENPIFQAQYKRHNGQRFPADMYFSGDNKTSSAKMYCHVKQNEKNKEQKLKVTIHRSNGGTRDIIRNWEQAPDSFLTVIDWGFDSNGFAYPSRNKREKAKETPGGGFKVEPGEYWAVVEWGKEKDSVLWSIKYDPRMIFNPDHYKAQKNLYEEWKKEMIKIGDELEKINEAKALAQWTIDAMKYHEDSLLKPMKTLKDSLDKSWEKQMLKVFLKEGLKGIQDDSKVISGHWWAPYALFSTESAMPGENAKVALRNLHNEIVTWMGENKLIWEGPWLSFQKTATGKVDWPKEWKNQK